MSDVEVTTTKNCAICGQPGRYMVLGVYTVDVPGLGSVDIPNARVVECQEHGVRPVDEVENIRGRRSTYKVTAPPGQGQDICDNCQRPQAMVGQMYEYNVNTENSVRLCGECNDKIDYRDCRPVRNRTEGS